MNKLILCNVSSLLKENPENIEIINKMYETLPECRKQKADKLKVYADRVRSIVAGNILLTEYGVSNAESFIEEYGEQGKPYVKGWPIKYSISHSGDYVLVGFSDKNIGVDIQQHKKLKADIVGRFYHLEEQKILEACDGDNYTKMFFDIWALKESYIKYTGMGLSQGLSSFSVIPFMDGRSDEQAFVYNDIDGYSIGVVSDNESQKLEIKLLSCF